MLNWSSGYLYAISAGGNESVTANGTVGTATRLERPSGATVDSSGDVLVADPVVDGDEGCLSDHRRTRRNLARHVSDESPHYWGAAPAL